MIKLRSVTKEDTKLLWQWANDPEARKNSLKNIDPIPYDTHILWFQKVLSESSSERLWIVELDQVSVGSVRINLETHYVSVNISSLYRGKKIATKALQHLEEKAKLLGIRELLAIIREENAASQALFKRSGYKLLKRDSNLKTVTLAKEIA